VVCVLPLLLAQSFELNIFVVVSQLCDQCFMLARRTNCAILDAGSVKRQPKFIRRHRICIGDLHAISILYRRQSMGNGDCRPRGRFIKSSLHDLRRIRVQCGSCLKVVFAKLLRTRNVTLTSSSKRTLVLRRSACAIAVRSDLFIISTRAQLN